MSGAISQLFVGVAYLFVCLKALGGAFEVWGAIVQYVSTIIALSSGLSTLIEALGDLRNNTPFLHTVFNFLDLSNKMEQGDAAINQYNRNGYEIEFRNVSFKYPGQDNYALYNVSMKFHAGAEACCSGHERKREETTFIKLLCRLYDPTEGEILLNGINIQNTVIMSI